MEQDGSSRRGPNWSKHVGAAKKPYNHTRTGHKVYTALLSSVRINGDGQEVLYLAEGDNVRLGCPYVLDPEDYGPSGLDIEWMQVNSDPSPRENVFLSYQDKRINHGNLPHLQQRVRFAASDPSQYDASINLMNLQVSDTATYECRVKKTTMATRKVIVTVQARPAVPMCWTEGHMAHGNDVVLKCFANGGTPPLSYKWAKISGHTHPYRAGSYHSQHSFYSEMSYQESFHSSINQVSGLLNNGDLVLKDVSREDDGLYQCTVANHVGYSVCVVEVKVSDSRRVGVIIGAVLGSLLLLGCLLVGIWGLICCCCGGAGAGCARGTFSYSNGGSGGACGDLANEIREDAVAPGCKASGHGSRITHLLGYPSQTVSRSLRLKYVPPPSGGQEDVALALRTAAAACEAGPSQVFVKVTSTEPSNCAQGLLPGKDGLLV